MLPGICCIYFSNPFFSSPRVILSLPELLRLLPLHSFNFDFKVSIFWQFSNYFNWSVLFSGDGHINEQAAFFVSVFLITMSGLLALSHNLSALEYPTRLWCCLFLLAFGAHALTISRFFCLYSSLLLQLATWIMFPKFAKYWMLAFLDISQSSPWKVVTISFILPLS